MITNVEKSNIITMLRDEASLPAHWHQYFRYAEDTELCELTRGEFLKVIETAKQNAKPFIDSAIVVSEILTKFGAQHIFHRKFRERHPNSDSGQVLGMQLYATIVQDTDTWVCCKSQRAGHLFPNATYFL